MSVVFEPIGGGLAVATDAHCRVSLDGILLAKFAAVRPDDTAVDLGSGNGLIPLYWCRRDPPKAIFAVEREAAFAELLNASVARNRLEAAVTVLEADWNTVSLPAKADVITCNPPYFPCGAARPCDDPLRRAARHEDHPDALVNVCRAAKRLLQENGRFCLCHRPERLADVMAALQTAMLVPTRLQLVQNGDAAPWLVLCEAKHRGTLHVLPTLHSTQTGDHTAVYKKLYPASR